MNKLIALIITSVIAFGCKSQDPKTAETVKGYTTPDHYDGMTLVWRDEFNGDQLNQSDWNFETGGDGWGNHELEYYQDQNVSVKGGMLIIEARNENVNGRQYTSSRITTKGKQTFQYGRIDIRAKLPKGQGIWPALWMLGASIDKDGWPKCGELDMMEMIGGIGKDNVVHGTIHWDDNGHQYIGGEKVLTNGQLLADEFHVFTTKWTSKSVSFFLDDIMYYTASTESPALDEFRAPFYFLFNVAVGGDWPGNPDSSLKLPQQMQVDYIRVFQ